MSFKNGSKFQVTCCNFRGGGGGGGGDLCPLGSCQDCRTGLFQIIQTIGTLDDLMTGMSGAWLVPLLRTHQLVNGI